LDVGKLSTLYQFTASNIVIRFLLIFENIFRLIKHTGKLLEEKQEKLCIKVLQTLKEMMSFEVELGLKVHVLLPYFHLFCCAD